MAEKLVGYPTKVIGIIGNKDTGRNTLAARLLDIPYVLAPEYSRSGVVSVPEKGEFKVEFLVVPIRESDPGGPVRRWWNSTNLATLDGIIFVFSINDRRSYDDVFRVWLSRVRSYLDDIASFPPFIIVGNKRDTRPENENEQDGFVTQDEALVKSRSMGACQYLECGALNYDYVEHVVKSLQTHLL